MTPAASDRRAALRSSCQQTAPHARSAHARSRVRDRCRRVCAAFAAAIDADSIAEFLFTSGSTMLPKAVPTTHRMLCSNQQMLLEAFPQFADEPPILVDWLPWNHTLGGSHNAGIAVYNGRTLYIDDGKPVARKFDETLRNLREIAPTIYFNVPKGWEELTSALETDAKLRETFFSRVKVYFFAGAGLSRAAWDRLQQVTGRYCETSRPTSSRFRPVTTTSCTYGAAAEITRARIGPTPSSASAFDVVNAPAVRQFFAELLDRLNRESTGSATAIARLRLLDVTPSLDLGEITDNGSINQRAVLTHRAELVEAMHHATQRDSAVFTHRTCVREAGQRGAQPDHPRACLLPCGHRREHLVRARRPLRCLVHHGAWHTPIL
jgi:acyl-CoA synthetase (AMP-forming)/AMP-acid ligase II